MTIKILALSDGKVGTSVQACGLAEQLAKISGGKTNHTIVNTSALIKTLPPRWGAMLAFHKTINPNDKTKPLHNLNAESLLESSKPDIAIGCGTTTQSALLALKKATNTFTVCVQRPRGNESLFNAVVAPQHDYSENEISTIEKDPNYSVILTLGAVGHINKERLNTHRKKALSRFANLPTPRTAVLIGGNNRAFSLTPQICKQLATSIHKESPHGGIMISTSRRTDINCIQALAVEFSSRGNCFFYDGNSENNPYFDILAAADRFLVTGDSVNMISEACTTAKPVQILSLPIISMRSAKKFLFFHRVLQTAQCAHPWEGEFIKWQPHGLNDTYHAAQLVMTKWQQSILPDK